MGGLFAGLFGLAFAGELPRFKVTVDGSVNVPRIRVWNESRTARITRFEMTIGDTSRNFDSATDFIPPSGGAILRREPDDGNGGTRSDRVLLEISDFDPGESFTLYVDVDPDSENGSLDYRTVFFNNGSRDNTVFMATTEDNETSALTVPELPAGAPGAVSYTFVTSPKDRQLTVRSVTEAGGEEYVNKITVKVNGAIVQENLGADRLDVYDGDTIEITAPAEVFRDIYGDDITDSVANDPGLISDQAEERFTALGISVNDVPQTGNPTFFRFDIDRDTVIVIQWRHEYALSVEHDFSQTESSERDEADRPWAGPLSSAAEGSPDPPAQKNWIKRGELKVNQIDGQVLDFSRAGLDVRYVPTGYWAGGPPNKQTDTTTDAHTRAGYFVESHFLDPEGLVTKLQLNSDPAAFIWSELSASARAALTDEGTTTDQRRALLREQLDAFLDAAEPADTNRFPADAWSERTKAFYAQVADAQEPAPSLARLFRFLLEDSYPAEISNSRLSEVFRPFAVAQSPAARQQGDQFTMYGPGRIRYVWQLQFGVRVNVDESSRTALPRVFRLTDPGAGATVEEVFVGEGSFWFDPGRTVLVAAPALENSADPASLSLKGWFNGDGFYFSSRGDLDTTSGQLTAGGPVVRNNSPVAEWIPAHEQASENKTYRALKIPQLGRAARVLWQYDRQALNVQVAIGQFVFQGDPARAALFTTQPALVEQLQVTGKMKQVALADMAVWDPVAARLFPVVPGKFKAQWRPSPDAADTVDVVVTAVYPDPAHYPHIAGTPGVALDPDPADNFIYKAVKYTENSAVVDADKRFSADSAGKTVLLFSEIQRVGRGEPREFLQVRVVSTELYSDHPAPEESPRVGDKITDSLDRANLGTGYILFAGARYNPFIYDAAKLEGLAAKDIYDMAALQDSGDKVVTRPANLPGPIIPVNIHPGAAGNQRLVVVWYDDPAENDFLLWPYKARRYVPQWAPESDLPRIVIASQHGSESLDANGQDQRVVEAAGDYAQETTYNPSRLQDVRIYQQPDAESAGYNPNEEHALLAPSLRFADVSPRPPAAYALRDNDLNRYEPTSLTEQNQDAATYTSHPRVLVQFYDKAVNEHRMRVYRVVKEDTQIGRTDYRFAAPNKLVSSTLPTELRDQPHVTMEAGEPVIPFYPLGVAIGATPPPEIFGSNLLGQVTYWEDHRGSSWAVSGGSNAWFTVSFFYPLAPDFWWPPGQSGSLFDDLGQQTAIEPQAGDSISFLPSEVGSLLAAPTNSVVSDDVVSANRPTRILYQSEWPDIAPVLKSGETLTFQGGEHRADQPFTTVVGADGELDQVETPGLPGIVAFACAEVVFDSLNPQQDVSLWPSNWTARVAQVLEKRSVPLTLSEFPPELQPATKRTRLSQGKYVLTELPASLQNRVRFDPQLGKLEVFGLLNDKEIGDSTLTASPPAVYILEPNILTETDEAALLDLVKDAAEPGKTRWQTAVAELGKLSRNPSLIDRDSDLPDDPAASGYRETLEEFWTGYYTEVGETPLNQTAPLPVAIADIDAAYLVGLEPQALRDANDNIVTIEDPAVAGLRRVVADPQRPVPLRAFGPGMALIPNSSFLDPDAGYPDVSWVTVAENNDPSLGGSPITLHVVKVDRRERYRGAIKTVVSDNVFDENLVLRHTGDFGAKASDLSFEWWYRPDDGQLDVPPPDLIAGGQTNPWKLFPDPTGQRGRGRYEVTLKGNPNAPEALLADTWWFVRYRHANDDVQGTDWSGPQDDGTAGVNYTWAGAGNSDPFHDYDRNGIMDYRAQLAQGWIKRVLDAVNPYEARIRDFEGEKPSTQVSMIAQFGPRYEGPVALNPDKDVIENVGLIELYETILKRGRDLSIDLSRPVSTPAIANALQLASTRISDFYTILGNEAYVDALDPTIGIGSDIVEPGDLTPAVFSFQNQVASLIEEELALLRGVDDYFARPVYNRLFWNFTKGEGEAAYAVNYNVTDVNLDGFIDEDDAMLLYPQGHGDAWGYYLTALRNQYDLLQHPFFNWVSRSEFYNLQDIVIKVDFLDERKFAQTAAAKAKAGAEIVSLTYRENYVEDPAAQWQGYTDSNPDRAWGVQEWARRAAQGAYFDWITANALLPSQHPNATLEGIQKVDRKSNADIAVISANLNAIQNTFDQANKGQNPLGLAGNVVPFDINPILVEDLSIYGRTHFEQVYDRAVKAIANALTIWDYANESRNALRQVANSEAEFRNEAFQEDLSHRNTLIGIFGRPYEGTIGSGRVYPAGYDGPDLLLFMYVDVRELNEQTVPGPATSFAAFDASGTLTGGDLYNAFVEGAGRGGMFGSQVGRQNLFKVQDVSADWRSLFLPTFAPDSTGVIGGMARDRYYAVNYTDLESPKVPLDNLTELMPISAAGYTFQAPRDWGKRLAQGELQGLINQMLQQEAAIASAVGAWDALQGEIVRLFRLTNAKLDMEANIRLKNEIYSRLKLAVNDTIKGLEGAIELATAVRETTSKFFYATGEAIPTDLPIVGLAVSPGDALAPGRSGIKVVEATTFTGLKAAEGVLKISKVIAEIGLDIADNELELWEKREADGQSVKEALVEIENKLGDEPIKRIEIFKEIETLRDLSEQYRAKIDEGTRMIDERAAFNKRVAAQTQRSRYQDMTFRVSRNHALQSYRAAFDLAARYAYLAAKAYDYETNFDPDDPASPRPLFEEIVRARTLGAFAEGEPPEALPNKGGLGAALATLRANYNVRKSQLGINNPQIETGKTSLRTECFRILPAGSTQPVAGDSNSQFPEPGQDSDTLWQRLLANARVEDLWQVPEFRYYCRPFGAETDEAGQHVAEPGLVLRFATRVIAGQNLFGKPLSGADHAYDPSQYAIKIRSVGVWFSDYLSQDILNDLPAAPRVYLIPVGADVMSIPYSDNPEKVRVWKVLDSRIPVPLPATTAQLDYVDYVPVLDSLNGRLGEPRKFSTFRAYHDGGSEVNTDELVSDSRLIGRSVWNTEWILIIPGRLLNADPSTGLDRFIEQVSDIKLIFQTYGYSGG